MYFLRFADCSSPLESSWLWKWINCNLRPAITFWKTSQFVQGVLGGYFSVIATNTEKSFSALVQQTVISKADWGLSVTYLRFSKCVEESVVSGHQWRILALSCEEIHPHSKARWWQHQGGGKSLMTRTGKPGQRYNKKKGWSKIKKLVCIFQKYEN